MNMKIYAKEVTVGMIVVDCSQGPGRVLGISPVEVDGDTEPDYYAVVLLASEGTSRERRQYGLLTRDEIIEIKPIDDGLDAPIDLGKI